MNACVSDKEGFVKFVFVDGASGMLETYDMRQFERLRKELECDGGKYEIIDVPSVTLNKACADANIKYVDFLSIDTEGSGLLILQSIDFSALTIYAIAVENNFNEPCIREFLEQKGFKYITWLNCQDDIYIITLELI